MGENGGKLHPFSTRKGLVANEFLLDEGEECRSVTVTVGDHLGTCRFLVRFTLFQQRVQFLQYMFKLRAQLKPFKLAEESHSIEFKQQVALRSKLVLDLSNLTISRRARNQLRFSTSEVRHKLIAPGVHAITPFPCLLSKRFSISFAEEHIVFSQRRFCNRFVCLEQLVIRHAFPVPPNPQLCFLCVNISFRWKLYDFPELT